MADPLSVASGIAGLISLADIIFVKTLQIRKHYKVAKNAENDVENFSTQISVIAGTLKRLDLLAEALKDEPFDHSLKPETEQIREMCVRVHLSTQQKVVRDFFMKVNPNEYFNMSLRLRYPSTGLWIRHSAAYQRWLDVPHSHLWLSGIAGAGKSVLAGTIIEDALQRSGEKIAVAFFYCDYRNEQSQRPLGILGAIAVQIALQSGEAFDILQEYYEKLHPSQGLEKQPEVEGLQDTLRKMVQSLERALIVVDGIDEAIGLTIDLLPALLPISVHESVSLALISRDEVAIREELESDFSEISIAATSDDRAPVACSDGSHVSWIISAHSPPTSHEREALQCLPPDLPKSYERVLERVPKPQTNLVIKALNFIAYAMTPLSTRQLCEMVSIPPQGERLEADGYIPCNEILRACGSLVRTSNSGNQLEFAHSSVQQFLESDTLLDSPLRQYHLSIDKGHGILANECLRFLHIENFVRQPLGQKAEARNVLERTKQYSSYVHASRWWTAYAAKNMDDRHLRDLATKLFHPTREGIYTAWVTCFSILAEDWAKPLSVLGIKTDDIHLGARLTMPKFTTLHMAAMLALPDICHDLLKNNVETGSNWPTPQVCAIVGPGLFATKTAFADDVVVDRRPRYSWNDQGRFWSGVSIERVRKTIQVVSPGFNLTESLGRSKTDLLLAMTIKRAIIEGIDYLGLTSDIILRLKEHDEAALKSLSKFSHSLDRCQELKPWHPTRPTPDSMRNIEDCFKDLIQGLNPLIDEYPCVAQLCTIVWDLALSWDLSFTRNRFFVSPTISFSEDSLVELLFSAVRGDNLGIVSHALNDKRLQITDLHRGLNTLMSTAVEYASFEVIRLLLDTGCSATATLETNLWQPIHFWANRSMFVNDPDRELILQLLLDHGASTLVQDIDGNTAWHIASNNIYALKVLFKLVDETSTYSAMITRSKSDDTVLASALKRQKESCIIFIIDKISNDERYICSGDPISVLAAGTGSQTVVEGLLSLVCAILSGELSERKWATPIVESAVQSVMSTLQNMGLQKVYETSTGLCCIVPLLSGFGLNSINRNPIGPGDGGRYTRELSLVTPKLLLQLLSVTDRSTFLKTPTDFTVLLAICLRETHRNEHFRTLADFLLKAGAKLQETDGHYSPLEYICIWQNIDIPYFQNLLDWTDCSRLNDINPKDARGLIHRLIQGRTGRTKCMLEELLKSGASPNLRKGGGKAGITALNFSLSMGAQVAAHTLLENGADPTLCDERGRNAVLAAVQTHQVDFFHSLIAWDSARSTSAIDWTQTCNFTPSDGSPRQWLWGMNVLHVAASSGLTSVIALLRKANVLDMNSRSYSGAACIHYAALQGQVEVIRMLVDCGVDINSVDKQGQLALHWAVRGDMVAAARTLLELGSGQSQNKQGQTPLYQALTQRSSEMRKMFGLFQREGQQHEDIEQEHKLRVTIEEQLLAQSIERGDIEACKLIFDQTKLPIDLHMRLCSGRTPLMLAVANGQSKIAAWLLEHGASTLEADPLSKVQPYGTVLDLAISSLMHESLPLLLDAHLRSGASWLNHPSSILALEVSHNDLWAMRIIINHVRQNVDRYAHLSLLEQRDVLSVALNKQKPDFTGECMGDHGSALHTAARHACLEAAQILVENGADINAQNDWGMTPLIIASFRDMSGSLKVLKYLISRNASLDIQDCFGDTALMSSLSDTPEKALLLIEANASIITRSWDDSTVMHELAHTIERGFRPAFAALARKGVNRNVPDGIGATPVHVAMVNDKFTGLLLNGDFGMESLQTFLFRTEWMIYWMKASWLSQTFRLYRRRCGRDRMKALLTSHWPQCWPLFCCAAYAGCEDAIINILSCGYDIEEEGCAAGTALMAACEAGRLDAVKLLVRYGARLQYRTSEDIKSGLKMAQGFKDIVDWILVNQHLEQPQLESKAWTNNVSEEGLPMPWSGISKKAMLFAECCRWPQESTKDYLFRICRLRQDMRGKVVPKTPIQLKDLFHHWDGDIELSKNVMHTETNLREQDVPSWTMKFYVPKHVVLPEEDSDSD
ncbi:hypothetical protein SUNI508_12287 [Seiridium unicorne]|uniref:NACHT domain-containing protein n=1 Tax=Seiridium unicorne TaxID=138068 RepID=A0ABR2UEP3_9PEZI